MTYSGRIYSEDGQERVVVSAHRDNWTKTFPTFTSAFLETGRLGAVHDALLGDLRYLMRNNLRTGIYAFQMKSRFGLVDAGFRRFHHDS